MEPVYDKYCDTSNAFTDKQTQGASKTVNFESIHNVNTMLIFSPSASNLTFSNAPAICVINNQPTSQPCATMSSR